MATTPAGDHNTATDPSATDHSAPRQSVWLHGLVATVVAAAATTGVAAVARALGVEFVALNDPKHIPIPLLGFAELTVVFSLIGVALAAVLARTARHPRRAFLVTTLVLLALSFVPDLTDVMVVWALPTKIALVSTHAVAAAIVIPTLARRLAR
ncbi:MAG TPA: DUF6069 family protein [Aeromicrobium sp.]|nr:DUF6069 family protein [Aeromicrobium sp.]